MDTAGYALWTLEAAEWQADETTAAVTEYLLQRHKDVDYWKLSSVRPPMEASDFTTTYLALRSLGAYGTEAQQPRIDARIEVVKKWLLTTEPKETEDRVCHLRSLDYVAAGEAVIEKAAVQLVAEQRDDGGWAQLPKLKSDAYATGSVIVALMRAGGRSADDPAIVRGLSFLLKTQKDDGSWHVVTRSKPFQTHYESGFPHGKDQFISATASSWATLALLLSLSEK